MFGESIEQILTTSWSLIQRCCFEFLIQEMLKIRQLHIPEVNFYSKKTWTNYLLTITTWWPHLWSRKLRGKVVWNGWQMAKNGQKRAAFLTIFCHLPPISHHFWRPEVRFFTKFGSPGTQISMFRAVMVNNLWKQILVIVATLIILLKKTRLGWFCNFWPWNSEYPHSLFFYS